LAFRLTACVIGSLGLGVCFSSCSEVEAEHVDQDQLNYSFFVAGHVYGNPIDYAPGLYEPFRQQISFFENEKALEFGVFTGDVVPSPTKEYFDSAIVAMSEFPVPIMVTPGNHDRGDLFKNYFPEYSSETRNDDLFIYLAPEFCVIDGDQLEFLQSQIARHDSVNNIFVFFHELLWWTSTNEFSGIEVNWLKEYNPNGNFWSDIHPILDSLPNDVFLIAGDLGATKTASPFMYHQKDNITYIASGMGGNILDNFILIDVGEDHSVVFRHYSFTKDGVELLPDLTEFEMPPPRSPEIQE
jgi:hypothetical protein